MKIEKLVLGYFAVNCYIVEFDDLKVIIDPGADFKVLDEFLVSNNTRKPDLIINTHGHYDHISAVPELTGEYGIDFFVDMEEEQIITDPEKNCSSIFGQNKLSLKTYNLINSEDEKYFNSFGIEIIKTPGHTPGSIIIKIGKNLFTGDLLFKGSIGRTDLPGGSFNDIECSLSKLKGFDKDLEVFPGHGPGTNLNDELRTNPYLR